MFKMITKSRVNGNLLTIIEAQNSKKGGLAAI